MNQYDFKKLLKYVHIDHSLISLYGDNKSSIYLANNLVFHTKTKHIEIHYYNVKENVLKSEIDINHDKTYLQIDRMFTKLLVEKKVW